MGVALALAVVAPLLWQHLTAPDGYRLVDLEVYRDAGRSLLEGRDVYEHLTPVPQELPFTYPPFAALLSVPLAVVPFGVLGVLWTAGTVALLAGIVRSAFADLLRRTGPWLPVGVGALTGAMAWLLPMRDIVKFGQVNLVLVALVLADCTARSPRWPRGVLVGLAAAIKLTPAIFIPYLWLSGRRTAALTATATAAGATAAAAVIAPGTSVAFWTDALLAPDRLGENEGTSNQSLRGMLLRLPLPDTAETVLWILLVAVVGTLGLRRAAQAARAGDVLAGTAITGLLAALLSPVGWIHHLCWVVLAIAVLARDPDNRRRVAMACAVWLFFVLKAPWWALGRLRADWPPEPFWLVLQDSFGLVAIALVCLLPWHGGRASQGSATG